MTSFTVPTKRNNSALARNMAVTVLPQARDTFLVFFTAAVRNGSVHLVSQFRFSIFLFLMASLNASSVLTRSRWCFKVLFVAS